MALALRQISEIAIITVGFCMLLVACAGRTVQLRSEPTGAEIKTLAGEVLGVTPLTLESTKLEQVTQEGKLRITLNHSGFEMREVAFDVKGSDIYTFKLSALDGKYFQTRVLKDFSQEMSVMARELLQLQGSFYAQKTGEVEKKLEDFIKKYPHIAAVYVMGASLAIKRGDLTTARRYLTRAQALDPTDTVVGRMLSSVENGFSSTRQPSGGDQPPP